ncbi:MAG: 3-phosphoshikimate 1-carboxyvinyltransferase [Planctomycetota bacterium]
MSPGRLGAVAALVGSVAVPGDKSTTHRALLLGALAEGRTVVRSALDSFDTQATARAIAALGAKVVCQSAVPAVGPTAPSTAPVPDFQVLGATVDFVVEGVERPRSPAGPLDCANSGTTARLLLGLLAGHAGQWHLDGDASLRGRPMGRVTRPLRQLGAQFAADAAAATGAASATGDESPERLPILLLGRPGGLRGGRVEVDLPSAQVKSALLLAGLRCDAPLTVVQRIPTRDHTERLLPRFGLRVELEPGQCCVHPGRPRGAEIRVPGDPSSAAFLLVAALLAPGSEVWVRGVGLWPRRLGFLRALQGAGADLMLLRRDEAGDPVGDLRSGSSELSAFDIRPADVPDLVDELPILALAASRARGTSRFAGLAELRAKESDRLLGIAALLAALGVRVDVGADELQIHGVTHWNFQGTWPATEDHRLAMTAGVAARVGGWPSPPLECADVSFPGFAACLASLHA